MSKDQKNLIVGLDLGTSKVVAVVAQMLPDGRFSVLGKGQADALGMKKGVVVNIEATVDSIQKALLEAEKAAGCKIKHVYTGIAGSHIRSFNSTGMVAIKEQEVSIGDIERVMETAKAINLPHEQQLLHVVQQAFIIDQQDDVKEPIGMNGRRLEVKVHIVTGALSSVQNVVKCVRRCGLEITELVLQPLASSDSVLTEDEKELGVIMIDIGAGTTDIAVYSEGSIRHTSIIPIAGDQITNDLAVALRTPPQEAESIKILHGCARKRMVKASELVEVKSLGDRPTRNVSRADIASIIEPRVEELIALVYQIVVDAGYGNMQSAGIVLTGGTAMLSGVKEITEALFQKPVRIGIPLYEGNNKGLVDNPRYATVMGLLNEAKNQTLRKPLADMHTGSFRILARKAKDWFIKNF